MKCLEKKNTKYFGLLYYLCTYVHTYMCMATIQTPTLDRATIA